VSIQLLVPKIIDTCTSIQKYPSKQKETDFSPEIFLRKQMESKEIVPDKD